MSTNKIFIQDIVEKMDGKPETELPKDTIIRFEIDEKKFMIKFTTERFTYGESQTVIAIQTTSDSINERITVMPASTNKIIIL